MKVCVGDKTERVEEKEPAPKAINRLLPTEVLYRVFYLLPPRDLKTVVLVCRWWREVGEAPALWVWVCLKVKEESGAKVQEMLVSRRLQAVRRIELEEVEVSSKLLGAVARHPGLQEMEVDADISTVDPELLARTVLQLEDVDFVLVTPQQVTTICTHMTGNSKLKNLGLSCEHLSSVDAEVLARAVTQLEEVYFDKLTCHQVTAICTAMKDNSKLRKLNLSYTNLSLVEPGLLSQAVTRLGEVDLSFTDLTPPQAEALFGALSTTSQLKVLKISGSNLSTVDPDMMALAVSKLIEANINNTQLIPQQVEAIFAALETPSQLKTLHLKSSNLSSVDPGVLARVVNKLETVEMNLCHLTVGHLTQVLTQALAATSLLQLLVGGNDCGQGAQGVGQQLIDQAKEAIQHIHIW